MLQDFRDRLTGPLTWFVVGIIVIPFAFFGIETFRGGGGDPLIAKVGDAKIKDSQFRAGYEQRMRQLQALMGEGFREDLIDKARFRENVLNDMVQESVLRQHVQDEGYRASNAMVFEAIEKIPAFQDNGKFSTETYRSRLAAQGYSPERFEQQVRDAIVVDQMREGVLASAFTAPADAAQYYRLDHQQRWLAYATFEAARYLPQVQILDADVQKRYQDRPENFQAPERLRVAYVELALEALPPAPAPETEVLKLLYDSDKATRFTTVEERQARHILVNFGADKDSAKKRIEGLAQKIAQGADFASLASSQSDDPGSKTQGGDLGWVRRGQMLEKFEQALFGLSRGEVSAPVETEFGWHLIKLDDLREARTKPFEDAEVQAELLAAYRQRDAERRYQELSEKIETTAFESPGSLDPVAQASGLPLQTTDWFTRTAGAGIAGEPAIREAAFADEVLQGGENSRPIAAGENRIVVLRKQEYEAPRQRELGEVAGAIREQLKLEAARTRAATEAADALSALASGRALEQVVTQRKAVLKAPGLVGRGVADVDPRITDALFALPRPAAGDASRTTVALPNGDVAVVVSTTVQDGDWAAAAPADRSQQLAHMRESIAGAELDAYRADLEKRTKVEIVRQPEAEPAPLE
ncbi:MAG: SurA N-terminal domain-containing protein [Gammaproteobacteria bacterium]